MRIDHLYACLIGTAATPSRVSLRGTILIGIIAGVYVSANPAGAQDAALPAQSPSYRSAPAVNGFNGKVDDFGGNMAHRSIYGSRASLAFPFAGRWGAQIDGAAGSLDRRGFAGAGGHLFWRDPGQALLGIYVSHAHLNQFGGVYVTQVAGEGEVYWKRWTLQGIVGVESGNAASEITRSTSTVAPVGTTPGVRTTETTEEGYDVKTRFFDQINLKYYLTDNWDTYVGHRYLGGKHALALGTEYAHPLGRGITAAAFLEGRIGKGDFDGVWGGLRLYFGQSDKTLIARHRQDDPPNWLVDSLFSIVNSYFTTKSTSTSQFCTPPDQLINGSCDNNI